MSSEEHYNLEKLKGIPRFVIKDMEGNPKYVIEDLSGLAVPERKNEWTPLSGIIGHEQLISEDCLFPVIHDSKAWTKFYNVTADPKPGLWAERNRNKFLFVTDPSIQEEGIRYLRVLNQLKGYDKTYFDLSVDKLTQIANKYPKSSFEEPNRNRRFMTQVSPEVAEFVMNLQINQNEECNLDKMLEKVRQYLESQNIEHQIKTELFTDPEFPNSQDIDLIIRVKQNDAFVRESLKPEIYRLINEFLPSQLIDKIFIELETFT